MTYGMLTCNTAIMTMQTSVLTSCKITVARLEDWIAQISLPLHSPMASISLGSSGS
jgi:hypothetical protein